VKSQLQQGYQSRPLFFVDPICVCEREAYLYDCTRLAPCATHLRRAAGTHAPALALAVLSCRPVPTSHPPSSTFSAPGCTLPHRTRVPCTSTTARTAGTSLTSISLLEFSIDEVLATASPSGSWGTTTTRVLGAEATAARSTSGKH
jgi:hypothetical protein